MDFDTLIDKDIKEISDLIEIGRVCPLDMTFFFLEKISKSPYSSSVFGLGPSSAADHSHSAPSTPL